MSLIGKRLGNYDIQGKLGEGGMGIVYMGVHPQIGKKVAVKVLHPELSDKADVVTRFFNEAKAVNDVVKAPLEQSEHFLARAALTPRGLVEIAAELPLENAIDAPHLLLIAQTNSELAQLDSSLAVLARRVGAPRHGALLRIAALSLQVELHPFAPAEPADRTNIPSHLSPTASRVIGRARETVSYMRSAPRRIRVNPSASRVARR